MTRLNKVKGFTLLEILIALSIFSIMAVVATTALYNIFHTQEAINNESAKLSELQLTFIRLERDISQMVNRPISLSPSSIEMTSFAQTNPLGLNKTSSLSRIKYTISESKLLRFTKPNATNLDTDDTNQEVLLDDVQSLSFHFLDDKYQLQDTWYARYLPIAIRVDLDSLYFGKISRIFTLPQSIKVSIKHRRKRKKVVRHERKR